MATSYKRFQQGSGSYNCELCGKLTRETGYGEADLNMCARCLLDCYVVNAEADYGTDSPEYKKAAKDLADWDAAHPAK